MRPNLEAFDEEQQHTFLQDQELLINMLNKHAGELSPDSESVLILSIGCGYASDALPLLEYYSKQIDKGPDSVQYIGIDINSSVININKNTYAGFKNIEFYRLNINEFDELKKILNGRKANVVYFGHPIINNWFRAGNLSIDHAVSANETFIAAELPDIMAPGCFILASHYTQVEKNHFNECILKTVEARDGQELVQNTNHIWLNYINAERFSSFNIMKNCVPKPHPEFENYYKQQNNAIFWRKAKLCAGLAACVATLIYLGGTLAPPKQSNISSRHPNISQNELLKMGWDYIDLVV